MKLTSTQEAFMRVVTGHDFGDWSMNDDGTVDVKGNVSFRGNGLSEDNPILLPLWDELIQKYDI